MNRIQYFVTEYQGLWFVILQGRRHGPYPSQQAAIDEAVRGAQTVPGSEVLVKTADDQVRTVWTDDSDPECKSARASRPNEERRAAISPKRIELVY